MRLTSNDTNFFTRQLQSTNMEKVVHRKMKILDWKCYKTKARTRRAVAPFSSVFLLLSFLAVWHCFFAAEIRVASVSETHICFSHIGTRTPKRAMKLEWMQIIWNVVWTMFALFSTDSLFCFLRCSRLTFAWRCACMQIVTAMRMKIARIVMDSWQLKIIRRPNFVAVTCH